MNFSKLGAALGLEEDEYRELIDLFIESGTADLKRLQHALAAGDLDLVRRCAHTIRGAAGNLGLSAFQETARKIEHQAEHDLREGVPEAVEVLAAQYARLQKLRATQ